MARYNILLIFICVFISFTDCFPASNSTQMGQKRAQESIWYPKQSNVANVRAPTGNWARDRNTTSSRIAAPEEKFVFPDDDKPPSRPHSKNPPSKDNKVLPRFKPINDKPPCAGDSTYCEMIDDYPGSYLESMFTNAADEFNELFGRDEIKSPPIKERFDGETENDLCASFEEVVYPKIAKTKDEKWLYIVNHGEHVQGVRTEKCLKQSDKAVQSCLFAESFPLGYKTVCKQKYIYRKLVALNDEGKQVTDFFPLPSCCSCSVVSNGVSSRQAALQKKQSNSTNTMKDL